jgi:hypothetical protein
MFNCGYPLIYVFHFRFAQLTQAIIDEDAVPLDRFVSSVLPGLFSLSQDNVPNVRISVAKTFSQSLLNKGEINLLESYNFSLLLKLQYILKSESCQLKYQKFL